MRTSLALVAFALLGSAPARAGSKHGDSGSRGPLGQVTSGIHHETSSSHSSSGGSSGSSSTHVRDHRHDDRDDDRDDTPVYAASYTTIGDGCAGCTPSPPFHLPHIDVGADGFVGAQKVVDSNAALSLELAVIFQHKLRLTAAVSHYFEDEMDGARVTLTAPSLTVGGRILGGKARPTALWIECGVVHVQTADPLGSAGITGSYLGGRVEHRAGDVLLIGSGGAMMFDGVMAGTARAAVSWNHLEAGFRVLDFSVGPALWGPEIGLSF